MPSKPSSNLQPISVSTWLETFRDEILNKFVAKGGSLVRFVAGDNDSLAQLTSGLQSVSEAMDYHFVIADAGKIRDDGKKPDYHQIDKLFLRFSQSINWTEASQSQLLTKLSEKGIILPGGVITKDIEAVAEANGLDKNDLVQKYNRLVTDHILNDHGMAVQLRVALAALGRSQLIPDEMSPTTSDVLLSWLHGKKEPGSLSVLKRIRIFEQINRSNAKFFLQSLTHWIPETNKHGLVCVLDFRAYEHVRKTQREIEAERNLRLMNLGESGQSASNDEIKSLYSDDAQIRSQVHYSNGAYTQMLELLRHFIDDIEQMDSFVLVVLGSPEFFDDRPKDSKSQRRFSDYNALQTRIGLEIRDIERQNPSAALTFIGGGN